VVNVEEHREVRKIDVSMSQEDIEALISAQPLLRLATSSKSAEPHAATIWYVYLDGSIYFTADEKTRKIRNIKENSRVSLVIDFGTELFKVKGLMINGEARIVKGQDIETRVRALFAEKYFESEDDPEFKRLDYYMKRQAFVKIEPKKTVSWDYTKWDKE